MKHTKELSSADKYHQTIDKINRRLSRYNPQSVLREATEQLDFCNTLNSHVEGMPWIVFFTLKLSMLNGIRTKPDISKKEFNKIANSIYSIQHLASDIGEGGITLKLRSMILQQSWYQNSETKNLISIFRQNLWFSGKNEYYEEKFLKSCGLKLSSYYLISVYLVVSLNKCKPNMVGVDIVSMIRDLCPALSIQEIYKFLLLAAIPAEKLPAFFIKFKLTDQKNQQSEYFQPTPIRYRPIIFSETKAFVLSRTILSGGLGAIAVDKLKKEHKEEFKQEFGKDMELYVGKLIADAKLKALNENEIKSLYRANSIKIRKITDYLIDGEVPILIECKAIEPGDIVKSSFDPEVLVKNLKDSFIKAIAQGQETAEGLKKIEGFKKKEFIQLVVTHEDFWIAGAADVILISSDAPCNPGEDGEHLIKPERVLFISIECLETLLEVYMRGEADLVDTLEVCIDKLQTKEGMRFTASQAIFEIIQNHAPNSLLQAEATRVLDNLGQKIQSNVDFWSRAKDAGKILSEYNKLIRNLDSSFAKKTDW